MAIIIFRQWPGKDNVYSRLCLSTGGGGPM